LSAAFGKELWQGQMAECAGAGGKAETEIPVVL